MSNTNRPSSKSQSTGKAVSEKASANELTQRNVELIRQLEESAKQKRTRTDLVAEHIPAARRFYPLRPVLLLHRLETSSTRPTTSRDELKQRIKKERWISARPPIILRLQGSGYAGVILPRRNHILKSPPVESRGHGRLASTLTLVARGKEVCRGQ